VLGRIRPFSSEGGGASERRDAKEKLHPAGWDRVSQSRSGVTWQLTLLASRLRLPACRSWRCPRPYTVGFVPYTAPARSRLRRVATRSARKVDATLLNVGLLMNYRGNPRGELSQTFYWQCSSTDEKDPKSWSALRGQESPRYRADDLEHQGRAAIHLRSSSTNLASFRSPSIPVFPATIVDGQNRLLFAYADSTPIRHRRRSAVPSLARYLFATEKGR